MRNTHLRSVLFILTSVLIVSIGMPTKIAANLGVGVGTGKIVVDKPLPAGTMYELPPLSVINTGDELSKYAVGISGTENQSELMPKAEWFSFSPSEFELAPGFAQTVTVTLTVPLRVEPGDYFAFVEGHPVRSDREGASVGIAAAAKLYFRVEAANPILGLYYRLISFWRNNAPWTNIVGGAIVAALIISTLHSRFDFRITKKKS